MRHLVFFCLIGDAFGFAVDITPVKAVEVKVIGGRNTTIEKYPYQLSLEKHGNPICGASIISRKWALTAAHCVEDTPFPTVYKILAGSTFRQGGGHLYSVKKLFMHEKYDSNIVDRDVALLQIEGEFDIGNKQGIISLPKKDEIIEEGTQAVITGWGLLSPNGVTSMTLQVVTLPIMSQKDCRHFLGDIVITKRMLCAGYSNEDKGACRGDSGGPLVADGKQVGIVSFGKGTCTLAGRPGVYARVAALREWIREKSGV